MLPLLLLIAAPAAAQTSAPAAPGSEPVAATTLTGESCVTNPRADLAPLPGLPRERTIVCAGGDAGAVAFALIAPAALSATGDARKTAIAEAFLASRAWQGLQARLTCEESRWLDDGPAPVLAIPCRTRNGGYPDLVLVGIDGSHLTIADGPASVWPALRSIVKSPGPDEARSETIARLQGLWKDPVVLASAADLARIKRLMSEARTAAGASRYADAEAGFRSALDTQTRLFSANDVATADIMMELALSVSNQGRSDEAAALFRQAATVIERSPNASDRARLETYRGFEAANRGNFAEALLSARVAVEAWRKLAGDGGGAPAAGGAAGAPAGPQFAGGIGGRPAGGRPGAPRAGGPALAAAQGAPTGISGAGDSGISANAAQGSLALSLNLEAQMELRTGDITSAYASAGEALLILDRIEGEPRAWRADVLATLGEVSSAQGRISAAEAFLKGALATRLELFGEGAQTLATRVALGRAYQAEGMNTSTIITYREAFRAARSLPKGAVPFRANDLIPFAAAVVDYAATLDDEKERTGLFTEAFDAFQFVRGSTIDKTIGRSAARLAQDNPEIAALLRTIEEAERAQSSARLRLANEQSLPAGDRSALVEDKLAAEVTAQGKAAAEGRQALTTRFPDFAGLTETQPPTLDKVRERIGTREGVVSFLIGRDRSFAMLIRRDGLLIAPVPAGAASLRASVQGLRRALEIQGRTVGDFDLDSAYELYRNLFGGLEPAMADLDRFVVVPSGPLSSLPFGLLVTAPAARDDYRGAKWLMRRATLVHAPSLASFVSLRATMPAKRPDLPLLAFGNPVLGTAGGGNAQRSALNQVAGGCRTDGPMPAALLRSLASLPDTATEVQAVAKALGAGGEVNLAANATEGRLRGDSLDRYRVLYFATHGLLPGELKCQGEPGLVLTPPATAAASKADDGLLEASEVAGLSLNADLVVLSACNTAAGGASLGGEAMSGLSEAFFHAGARNMIVSHWQVPSAATTSLMTGLFSTLGTSSDASGALRTAQLRLADNAQTAHPFFWAAFVLMGAGEAPTAQTEAGR